MSSMDIFGELLKVEGIMTSLPKRYCVKKNKNKIIPISWNLLKLQHAGSKTCGQMGVDDYCTKDL